jgi:hypothetical protein
VYVCVCVYCHFVCYCVLLSACIAVVFCCFVAWLVCLLVVVVVFTNIHHDDARNKNLLFHGFHVQNVTIIMLLHLFQC